MPEVLAPAPKKVHSPSPKRRPILKPKLGKRPEGGVTGTAVEKVNGEGGKDELEDVSKHMKSPDDVSSIQQELEQLQVRPFAFLGASTRAQKHPGFVAHLEPIAMPACASSA